MLDLILQTPETAPEGSIPALEAAKAAYGFIPNLIGALANSPAAANAYMGVAAALELSSLTPVEQQIVLLATSIENRCHYCVAAHSVVAGLVGADEGVVEAIRENDPILDERLDALRAFTTSVVRHRGWIPQEDLETFLAAGYTRSQVLDVLTGVTLKTLSNYMNHMAATPVDAGFQKMAWSHPAERVTTGA